MYRSNINIRHGCLSHLFWGRSKTTDEYISIDNVPSKGLSCNCKCPVCSGDFIACIGEHNRPHFKHQSKYKCMYTDEITTYLRTVHVLKTTNQIALPAVNVHFGSRTLSAELNKPVVFDVYYHCDDEQYPPLLIAIIDNRPTRIILAFDGYYTAEDVHIFRNEATQNKWNCLFVQLPQIGVHNYINTEQLQQTICSNRNHKTWIHSELEPYWQQQLNEATIIPKVVFIDYNGSAFDCPLHIHLHNDYYFARSEDCIACPYYFGTNTEHRCSATAGIMQLRDFTLPEGLRKQRLTDQRQENEAKITEETLLAEQANKAEQQQAEQRMYNFYIEKTCPICGKKLHKMPGKKGINWLCLTNKCNFTAFENHETGEVILNGID